MSAPASMPFAIIVCIKLIFVLIALAPFGSAPPAPPSHTTACDTSCWNLVWYLRPILPLTKFVNALLSYATVNPASVNNSKLDASITFIYTNLPSISVIPETLSNSTMFPLFKPCAVVVVTKDGVLPDFLTILCIAFSLYILFCKILFAIIRPKNSKLSLVCSSCEVIAILPLTLE